MGEQVRVILEEGGLKVTRHKADEAKGGGCEHRLTRQGGFQHVNAMRNAVMAVEGVSYAYTSPGLEGGTVFYGLSNDVPAQYLPVASCVVEAVRAVL